MFLHKTTDSVGDAALGVPRPITALASPIPATTPIPTAPLATPIIQFTPYGNIVKKHIENIPNVYSNVFFDKYIIMPNHIHLLLRVAVESNNGTVGHGTPMGVKHGTAVEVRHGTPRAASHTVGIFTWEYLRIPLKKVL
ncbi:MAG: hypothetical protein LBS45_04355 [Synergistaceae bacterium]|nr:hypothetical protein [Synergistaceae bacterium]